MPPDEKGVNLHQNHIEAEKEAEDAKEKDTEDRVTESEKKDIRRNNMEEIRKNWRVYIVVAAITFGISKSPEIIQWIISKLKLMK